MDIYLDSKPSELLPIAVLYQTTNLQLNLLDAVSDQRQKDLARIKYVNEVFADYTEICDRILDLQRIYKPTLFRAMKQLEKLMNTMTFEEAIFKMAMSGDFTDFNWRNIQMIVRQ